MQPFVLARAEQILVVQSVVMSQNALISSPEKPESLEGQAVDSENPSAITISAVLKKTWQVWRANARLFVFLMGLVVAAIFLMAMIVNYVIAPHPAGLPLKEVWQAMGFLQKLAVFVLFLMTLAVQHRALAASTFATQEIWNGRTVRFWQAVRSVRRKQLRLFWMVLFASFLTGPFGLIVGPILIFATAPGIPVAILEGKTAFAAVKRGDALLKHDFGKIAILVILWLSMAVAAVVAWIRFLMFLEDQFGQPLPLYLRLVPAMGFWLILLVPQLYIIALALIYFERLKQETDGPATV